MGQRRSDDGSNLELAADELVLRSRAFDALLSYANDGAAHPGKLGPSVFVIECREPIHSFIHSFIRRCCCFAVSALSWRKASDVRCPKIHKALFLRRKANAAASGETCQQYASDVRVDRLTRKS